MTTAQRILAYTLAGFFWLACIVLKHYLLDIDVTGFETACIGVITALGADHVRGSS